MNATRRLTPQVLAGAALAIVGSVGIGAAALGQNAAGEPVPTVAGFVHAGTCDALGERVHTLEPVAVGAGVTGERVGAAAAAMTYSISDLDADFENLVDAPHAIVVPGADDAARGLLACGEIGGYIDDDGLVIGLRRPDGPALAGMAFLWDDDDAVEVELYLPQGIADPAA